MHLQSSKEVNRLRFLHGCKDHSKCSQSTFRSEVADTETTSLVHTNARRGQRFPDVDTSNSSVAVRCFEIFSEIRSLETVKIMIQSKRVHCTCTKRFIKYRTINNTT